MTISYTQLNQQSISYTQLNQQYVSDCACILLPIPADAPTIHLLSAERSGVTHVIQLSLRFGSQLTAHSSQLFTCFS